MNDDEIFERGLALYRQGEPFEAHEEWERCWKSAKSRGDERDERFLRALIHLCAARIKVRQKNAIGLRSHLESAVRLLDEVKVETHRGIDVVLLRDEARAFLTGDNEQVDRGLPRAVR